MKNINVVVTRDSIRAKKFCILFGLTFGRDQEEGFNKKFSGCIFDTYDITGKRFLINLCTNNGTRIDNQGWSGKRFLWKSVSMPKFYYDMNAMFQVIFNEEGTACVVARRDSMKQSSFNNRTMYSTIWKVYDMTRDIPVVIQTSEF